MNVLIAGDFCPQHRVASLFDNRCFSTVLDNVKPLIERADYSIVNLECPVIKGKESPIVKQGPNWSCKANGVEAIKWAGFKCVTLANNHFFDFGEEGVYNTLEACKTKGVDTVGGGQDVASASKTLYKEVSGKKLAVINCCEHEYSIATESHAGANPLNPIQQYYAIHEARKIADYVLVIVHGGHEMWQLPSLRMVETYRFFIDVGADAVINHHQHCFSGYEVYCEKPIFYGLGNFCFDKANRRLDIWYEGLLVELCLDKQISFRLYPYRQCLKEPCIKLLDEHEFDERLEELNELIANPNKLRTATNDYYKSCANKMTTNISPLSGRLLQSLNHRGILPSFVTNDWLLRMRNFVLCESYREKLEWLFVNSENRKKII